MDSVSSSSSYLDKLKLTLKMIKVQHTVFALPFVLASLVWASESQMPSAITTALIILAVLTARNTAMSFNRIADRRIDKLNPRTQSREIPSGKLSLGFAITFCAVNAILFIVISSYFNTLSFMLSPVALLIVAGYSLTKKFTHYTQLFLGFALGIAPLACWIAIKGHLDLAPSLLGAAVFFWVAGFDIIYSCLDHDYDKSQGLKNMVVQWGKARALLISKVFHVFAVALLIVAGSIMGVSWIYYLGTAVIGAVLAYEQSLVKADDLSKVNMAFFTLNGYVSLLFLGFVLADRFISPAL